MYFAGVPKKPTTSVEILEIPTTFSCNQPPSQKFSPPHLQVVAMPSKLHQVIGPAPTTQRLLLMKLTFSHVCFLNKWIHHAIFVPMIPVHCPYLLEVSPCTNRMLPIRRFFPPVLCGRSTSKPLISRSDTQIASHFS